MAARVTRGTNAYFAFCSACKWQGPERPRTSLEVSLQSMVAALHEGWDHTCKKEASNE